MGGVGAGVDGSAGSSAVEKFRKHYDLIHS